MTDPETTATNWSTRWAQGRAWALAHPKATRAILLAVLLCSAFLLGRCTA